MARINHYRHPLFVAASLLTWIAIGWSSLNAYFNGALVRGHPVSESWLAAFGVLGLAIVAGAARGGGAVRYWTLTGVQFASIVTMMAIVSNFTFMILLAIVAWRVACALRWPMAIALMAAQSVLAILLVAWPTQIGACPVIGLSIALQMFMVFTAQSLRNQVETAQALERANARLVSAQALLAADVRAAERLRISRELHDAWGHELTALGLQLETAAHLTSDSKAAAPVSQARTLARELLAKVRDVVATLREAERCDLHAALTALADGVPTPAIHVHVPHGVAIPPDHAHALLRCAQEAVTNCIRHARADNLWLEVRHDDRGVRLIARDDGAVLVPHVPGKGLTGMRERLEGLDGRLAVHGDAGGFLIDAWLPCRAFAAP